MAGTDTERAGAFRGLVEGHMSDAFALANAILRNPTESEDAVHDAFVSAWQRWPSLRDASKFDSWFKRIVINTCKNRLRDGSRRQMADISTQVGLSTPDASKAVHDRAEVAWALSQLKPDDRIVLALRYYRDLKVDAIADLLDIRPGTATSRLRSAHERLRRRTLPGGDLGPDDQHVQPGGLPGRPT